MTQTKGTQYEQLIDALNEELIPWATFETGGRTVVIFFDDDEVYSAVFDVNGKYLGEDAEEKPATKPKPQPFTAYLAGPIFTYGDLLRNTEWAAKLREAFPTMDLYSPVENTDINGVEGKKKFAGSKEIATADNARLDKTDVLIACIDGDVLPAGTCAEIGKFHEKIVRGDKKFIVGICTDNRQCALTHSDAKDRGGAASLGEQQYSYQNLYVTGLIKDAGVLVSSIDEAIAAINRYLGEVEWHKQHDKR